MAIYTELFCHGTNASSGTVTAFTVPLDGVTVVRDIVMCHQNAASSLLVASVVSPGGVEVFIASWLSVPTNQVEHWQGRQVLPPGWVVNVYSQNGNLQYRMT